MNSTAVIKQILQFNKCIVAIQGASCVGKTALTRSVAEMANGNKIRAVTIHMDDFYKTFPNRHPNDPSIYDFDNPAAYNWGQLRECINGYLEDRAVIRSSTYDKNTMESATIEIENIQPQIIIIEGLYTFNLFNDDIFNIDEFDEYDSSSKLIENEYIRNETKLYKKMKEMTGNGTINLITVKMTLDTPTLKSRRFRRDKTDHNRNEAESAQRYENYILPATERWIYSGRNLKYDLELNGKSEMKKNLERLFEKICGHK